MANSSPLYKMMKRDFERTLADTQTSFWYLGKEYKCQFAASDDDFQLAQDGGGTVPIYNLIATTIKDYFPGGIYPPKGEQVTVDGTTYQVGRPQSRPGSPLVKLYFGNLDAA